jgi:hypothetical protein
MPLGAAFASPQACYAAASGIMGVRRSPFALSRREGCYISGGYLWRNSPMKYLSTKIFFLIVVFGSVPMSVAAQTVTYIDENGNPANERNYTYRRVIEYVAPFAGPSPQYEGSGLIAPGNNMTVVPSVFGHLCRLTDYYSNGKRAAVVELFSEQYSCTPSVLQGDATLYYRSGQIKQKARYGDGKLHGCIISYAENGSEQKRELYLYGVLFVQSKFPVPANSPMVGTWKYIKYNPLLLPDLKITESSRVTLYFDNSIRKLDRYVGAAEVPDGTYVNYWKYTPSSNSSGVMEVYQGDGVIERADVRWVNSKQFEYTITFSQNTVTNLGPVGSRLIFNHIGEATSNNQCTTANAGNRAPVSSGEVDISAIPRDSSTAAKPGTFGEFLNTTAKNPTTPMKNKDIALCRVELTDIGRTTRFHVNYSYLLDVNKGSVEKVTKLRKEEPASFIQEENFIECVKAWKIEPAGNYVVTLSFGTSGNENSMIIVGHGETTKIRIY